MRDSSALLGVTLMLLVALMSAADAVIVRLLAGQIHPFVIGFTRVSFGLLAMLPWILRRPGMLRTRRIGVHVLRAALKLGSLVALFAALAGAPLASVTAIGFAAPLFVSVGAWFLLSEQPQPLRILAAGYRGAGWSSYGFCENIAYGYTTVAAVMNAWWASAGHQANILNSNMRNAGFGYYNSTDSWGPRWVQDYGYVKY